MSRMQYQPRFLILTLFFIYLFFNGSILDNSFQIRVEKPKRPQVFCLFPTSIIEIEIPLELLLGVVFFPCKGKLLSLGACLATPLLIENDFLFHLNS